MSAPSAQLNLVVTHQQAQVDHLMTDQADHHGLVVPILEELHHPRALEVFHGHHLQANQSHEDEVVVHFLMTWISLKTMTK